MSWIKNHRITWLILVLILGISLDQVSKYLVQKHLKVYSSTKVIEVVPNFFNLIYKENAAAAFSLTQSIPLFIRRPLLVIISITAIIIFLLWYLRTKMSDGLMLCSFSFILAGAIGNLIDRVRLGYVIDFLDMHLGFLGWPNLHWPTYNVADSLIVIGALGVLLRSFWPYEEPRK